DPAIPRLRPSGNAPPPTVTHGGQQQRDDGERDERVVAGERDAEEAELHDVAGDHPGRVDVAQVVEADAGPGAGTGGGTGPEAPFDAGVINAQVGAPGEDGGDNQGGDG